jgi:hypothetical protein
MRYCVFAVRDYAVETLGPPVTVVSVGQAVRGFTDEVNRADDGNMMFGHPDDFALVYLADFDNESGAFSVPADGLRVVARGKDVKRHE